MSDPSDANDPFALQRFVDAQDDGGTYERAAAELRAGRKRTHWMWFVFPQLAGLGRSTTAQVYALPSLDAARAFLAHAALGPRLRECAQALLSIENRRARDVLGEVDALKLRSSMTLFALAAPEESVFAEVLARYFDGDLDGATVQLLR